MRIPTCGSRRCAAIRCAAQCAVLARRVSRGDMFPCSRPGSSRSTRSIRRCRRASRLRSDVISTVDRGVAQMLTASQLHGAATIAAPLAGDSRRTDRRPASCPDSRAGSRPTCQGKDIDVMRREPHRESPRPGHTQSSWPYPNQQCARLLCVHLAGLEPDRRKPRSSTISRSCSDHAGLLRRGFPAPAGCSRRTPTRVAATWQQDCLRGSLKVDSLPARARLSRGPFTG